MRRRLVVGAAAVTATVVIAFVVPLGFAVRVLAANRPLSAAEQTARSVATVVALTDDADVVAQAVAAARSQNAATVTVFFADGRIVGADAARTPAVDEAFRGAAFAQQVRGGTAVLVPAIRGAGPVAVVQAVVPAAALERGVWRSWLLLGGLAVALMLVAVTIADWLGRSVVRPVRALSETARRLAAGDLQARAAAAGPPEIAEVATALNGLAGRISGLLAAERELVAALSHRLRTPLTALRIDAEAIRDEAERDRLRADVDAVESTVTELIREARRPSAEPRPEAVNLVDVVRDRTDYWGALAEDQQRAWQLEITADEVPVRLERGEAEALVDVMLDNVFTHTPEGTAYRVLLSTHTFAVEDEGPGVTATRAARSAGGTRSTGLGLDIARQTAGRLGGELRVAPRRPRGTRVEVTLPHGSAGAA